MFGHDSHHVRCNPFTNDDRNTIRIRNNTIYQHCTARINYTTYDMRRDYDTVNPRTHPFVMVPSPEKGLNSHPFWYAAVLGIFHAEVQHIGQQSSDIRPKIIKFLWIRWLEPVYDHTFGQKKAKLPKLCFSSCHDEFTFGFLDPAHVLRGCHLMPAFADGKKAEPLITINDTEATWNNKFHDDWKHYYIGMCVIFLNLLMRNPDC